MASSPPAIYFLYHEKSKSGWALKIPRGHMPTQNTPIAPMVMGPVTTPKVYILAVKHRLICHLLYKVDLALIKEIFPIGF